MSTEATIRPATATTLAAEVHEPVGTGADGARATLVLQHGFAQDRRCLGPLAGALAADGRLVLPDAPGHGGSLRHADASLRDGARLLTSTGGRAVYVGYSMGGRLCLRAALDHPDDVTALVLIGATAGIEDPAARAERRDADARLAERLEEIGVEEFVQEWLSLPLFAGLPQWARFEQERGTNTADGLAAGLRAAGTGAMEPLWDRLGSLRVPVLLLTGAEDERYGELAERMVASIGGRARHEVVQGAGHAAHLERPERVIELVRTFLAETDLGAPG